MSFWDPLWRLGFLWKIHSGSSSFQCLILWPSHVPTPSCCLEYPFFIAFKMDQLGSFSVISIWLTQNSCRSFSLSNCGLWAALKPRPLSPSFFSAQRGSEGKSSILIYFQSWDKIVVTLLCWVNLLEAPSLGFWRRIEHSLPFMGEEKGKLKPLALANELDFWHFLSFPHSPPLHIPLFLLSGRVVMG